MVDYANCWGGTSLRHQRKRRRRKCGKERERVSNKSPEGDFARLFKET